MGQANDTYRRAARRLFSALAVGAALYVGGCLSRPAPEVPPPPVPSPQAEAPPTRRFEATAYSIEGRTKSGKQTRQGIVAADPKVLPIGSRIRVNGAGAYSGVYTVADTGRAIKGHEIDIYIADDAAARRFGRQSVEVEVLGREGQ